jgi:hypothetical protein
MSGAGPVLTAAPAARGGQSRPLLYVAVVLVALLAAYARELRIESIYACPAVGYSADEYLAYCQANRYGDYEHGALWFALEPAAVQALAASDVIFLGNSRLQWGFSSAPTAQWFAAAPARYYLLGFSYFETYLFEQGLLDKFALRPRAYVINIDAFFVSPPSLPARYVMEDRGAWLNYQSKHWLQPLHRLLCGRLPALCGQSFAAYRSRSTGAWSFARTPPPNKPISDDPGVDAALVQQQLTVARDFIARLPMSADCVVLTLVPTVRTKRAAAEALAAGLGMPLVAPEPAGLVTFDGSHLDPASAAAWSRAFLAEAGPRLQRCLGQ